MFFKTKTENFYHKSMEKEKRIDLPYIRYITMMVIRKSRGHSCLQDDYSLSQAKQSGSTQSFIRS